MQLDLLPPTGVGPVQIGAPLAEAESALALIDGYVVPDPLRPKRRGFATYISGLSIALHPDGAGSVMAIEVYGSDADTVRFDGVDVFRTPADEIIALLESRTQVQLEEEGRTVIAPDLPMSLWRGTLPDFPEDEDGRYFESALIARPGYFATPGA